MFIQKKVFPLIANEISSTSKMYLVFTNGGVMVSNLFVIFGRHGRVLYFQDLDSLEPLSGLYGSFHCFGCGPIKEVNVFLT